jgi:hypothetical protein
MGINIKLIAVCGCKKDNTINEMEKISEVQNNNKLTKIYKCRICQKLFKTDVYLLYDDLHKGVRSYE